MATITGRRNRLGNITFQVRVRKAGYPPLSRTFTTRMQAELWSQSIESELTRRNDQRSVDMAMSRLAESTSHERLTLGDLLIRYRERVTPDKRAAIEESWRIGGILKHPICLCTAQTLTVVQVAEWRDWRMTKVSGSTVNRDINLLSHVIEVSRTEWGIKLDGNPFQHIRRPRHNPPRERRITPDEETKLLQACDAAGAYMRRLIVLAIETGMRRGEIIGLEWARIDFERRHIHLTRTKTGVSRGVALSTRALNELLKILRELREWARVRRCELPPRVFPGLTPVAVGQCFDRTVQRAGLDGLHFHDLRHEAISRMFEKGLTMMEVAAISGHQTLQMLKRYTHLQIGELARKLDRNTGPDSERAPA
jgi:integrase